VAVAEAGFSASVALTFKQVNAPTHVKSHQCEVMATQHTRRQWPAGRGGTGERRLGPRRAASRVLPRGDLAAASPAAALSPVDRQLTR
jgi:hypothetical protein